MKKIVLIALAVVMALGCISAFATEATAPKMTKGVTILNGRSICPNEVDGMYMAWFIDGVNSGDWGGGDQWGHRTAITTEDCTIGFRGTFIMPGEEDGTFVEYPVIERIGYVFYDEVEDGEEDGTKVADVIWFDDFEFKKANELDANVDYMTLGTLQARTGSMARASIDTSTMKAGEYDICLVFQYNGQCYTWAQNHYGNGEWIRNTIRSTGANYVEPVEEVEEEPEEENPATGDSFAIVAILAAAALAVVIIKKNSVKC